MLGYGGTVLLNCLNALINGSHYNILDYGVPAEVPRPGVRPGDVRLVAVCQEDAAQRVLHVEYIR